MNPRINLKGPHGLNSLTHIHPVFQRKDRSSEVTRNIQGGTEFSGFRARAEGAALSPSKVPTEVTVHYSTGEGGRSRAGLLWGSQAEEGRQSEKGPILT